MQKVVYSGTEDGLFIFEAFYTYLERLPGFAKEYDARDRPFRLIGWKNEGKNFNVEYCRRQLGSREEITVTIFGEGSNGNMGEFERLLLEEHNKRKSRT